MYFYFKYLYALSSILKINWHFLIKFCVFKFDALLATEMMLSIYIYLFIYFLNISFISFLVSSLRGILYKSCYREMRTNKQSKTKENDIKSKAGETHVKQTGKVIDDSYFILESEETMRLSRFHLCDFERGCWYVIYRICVIFNT